MIDFGFSELAASDLLLANDVAELVASSSVVVGPERATAHAAAVCDPDTLAFAIKRLQPWALSGATRTALKEKPGLLDDLRRRLAPREPVNLVWLAVAGGGLAILSGSIAAAVRPDIPQMGTACVPRRQRTAAVAASGPVVADAARQPRRRHCTRVGDRPRRG